MPDATVDYDLSRGKWSIVQQQSLLKERTKVLYGSSSSASFIQTPRNLGSNNEVSRENPWNDLSEFYACEAHDVMSYDGIIVPLTVVYSRKRKKRAENPGLLHGHGAYGEILDKRWRSELKSLLDRGWVLAYADVRYFLSLSNLVM